VVVVVVTMLDGNSGLEEEDEGEKQRQKAPRLAIDGHDTRKGLQTVVGTVKSAKVKMKMKMKTKTKMEKRRLALETER
jgi:hypothetical protein